MGFTLARNKFVHFRVSTLLAVTAAGTLMLMVMPFQAMAEDEPIEAAAVAPCEPSERSAAVNEITVTPSIVSINDVVEVNFSGSLPDGGCAGDFIKIQVPEELAGLTGTFAMKAPDGTVIGSMVVTPNVVTITFNDYIETHDRVVFKGFLKARATADVAPGTEYDLEWHVGDTIIKTPLTTEPCTACEAAKIEARKFAVYEDGAPPTVRFGISTAATRTADEVITISDSLGSGQALDCGSIRMRVGDSLTAWGTVQWDGPWQGFKVVSCSDEGVTVTVQASKVGQFFVLSGRAVTTSSQATYIDKATVEQHGVIKGLRATARANEGGASGEGENRKPEIDIEKWSANQDPETGDYDEDSKLLDPTAAESITFTITNIGTERLRDLMVSDATTAGSGTVKDLTCDFSGLGGPSAGTTWEGPFDIGATFDCTGTLPALGFDATHSDTATVSAIGQKSDQEVTDSDAWNAHTPTEAQPEAQPAVDIEKWSTVDGPVSGDFDDAAKSVQAGAEPRITFTITNTGNEDLVDLTVTDKTIAGSANVRDLTCDFSELGGPSAGNSWAGPFAVGASFECQGRLTALGSGENHQDRATIIATGADSGESVTDSDDWNAVAQPDLPSTGQDDVPATGQPALPATGGGAGLLPIALVGLLMATLGIGLMRRRV